MSSKFVRSVPSPLRSICDSCMYSFSRGSCYRPKVVRTNEIVRLVADPSPYNSQFFGLFNFNLYFGIF